MANHGKLIQNFSWNFHFPGRHTGRFTGKLIQFLFRNFNSGVSHRPFYWKTHPLKIMSTYSVFFQFWGVTQTVLLENSSIKNHGYLFSFFQFWGVTQTVLLENSSRQFFKSFFNFFNLFKLRQKKPLFLEEKQVNDET